MAARLTEERVREIVRQELTLWLGPEPAPSAAARLGRLLEEQAISAAEHRIQAEQRGTL
ncbi:MAG: hypothetical protein J2P43_01215 [Candidatus Dormibacteraeota bacterium]|nr:hypothetical protein [Candidatus Dormibacteraeota bacterium]